jgi:carboxymethylenebutenolidase
MPLECRWEQVDAGDKAMSVYSCAPRDGGPHPAVIVVQEIFGVTGHIRLLTERIAELGYLAIAPDLFHRQGDRVELHYDAVPQGLGRMAKLKDDEFSRDMAWLLRELRGRRTVRKDRVATVGFSMGGRLSLLLARTHEVQAAVSFYGGGVAKDLAGKRGRFHCPILLFFGSEDTLIPKSEVDEIRRTLLPQGPRAEIKVYEGAAHGFFCDARASYHETAAEDAWRRTTQFLQRHLLG